MYEEVVVDSWFSHFLYFLHFKWVGTMSHTPYVHALWKKIDLAESPGKWWRQVYQKCCTCVLTSNTSVKTFKSLLQLWFQGYCTFWIHSFPNSLVVRSWKCTLREQFGNQVLLIRTGETMFHCLHIICLTFEWQNHSWHVQSLA